MRNVLRKIETTWSRISKIIKGIRTFAREDEDSPFRLASLSEILSDTLSLCGERLKSHHVALEMPILPPSLQIECRPIQLSQVLLNLLNNAFDAVEKVPEKRISVEVEELPNSIRIKISNSGPPIPTPLRERIMQPFFSTKEPGKGSGLGLSISKGIVETHQGRLDLASDPDQTTFIVTLPKRQEPRTG